MTALLAVEFEPEASTAVALHALKHPGLVITSLEVSVKDAVARVEFADLDVLKTALDAICNCSCVRAGAAFPSEA